MAAANLQAAGGSAVVDEASIIDRIMEAHGHVAPPPGSFTVLDYVERARQKGIAISGPNALKVLLGEMQAGRLHGRKLSVDGREKWVFW